MLGAGSAPCEEGEGVMVPRMGRMRVRAKVGAARWARVTGEGMWRAWGVCMRVWLGTPPDAGIPAFRQDRVSGIGGTAGNLKADPARLLRNRLMFRGSG